MADQIKAENRRDSFASQNSQTAKEYESTPLVLRTPGLQDHRFIESQTRLEADAREILPYVSVSMN